MNSNNCAKMQQLDNLRIGAGNNNISNTYMIVPVATIILQV